MEKLKFVILLSVIIGAVQVSRAADPLYCTPYIEQGRHNEAQLKAYVAHPELIIKGITSYSGYLTVNKQYDSNLFFWFHLAKTNPANAPVVLWLQGGPGASSLYGMFMENGPVTINSKKQLESKPYTWQSTHNMLYIDNPVGCGFSTTNNSAGYAHSALDAGVNLFEGLKQFFKLFPQYKDNKFYVAGESYAGKYVPAIGYQILLNSKSSDPANRINLKGLAIGNGVTDPIHQILFGEYFYQLGLIDKNTLATYNYYQSIAISLIQAKKFYWCACIHICTHQHTNVSLQYINWFHVAL